MRMRGEDRAKLKEEKEDPEDFFVTFMELPNARFVVRLWHKNVFLGARARWVPLLLRVAVICCGTPAGA